MSLIEHLTRLYTEGHAQPAPAAWEDPRIRPATTFKPASVLVAITDRVEPGLLLIHRPDHMRAHPGQVALPGGRRDPGEDAIAGALREAHEELGIDPARVTVIGASDVLRTATGYEITPVVAVVPADIAITPCPTEVASWFEVPLAYILDPANQVMRPIEHEGVRLEVVEIMWQGHRIWGVTGGILMRLIQRMNWTLT